MISYKLEKKIILYKAQFDKCCTFLYGDYRIDRLSLDLDGIVFRMKYMIKNHKDLDLIPELKETFIEKASELNSYFGEFLYYFIHDIIGVDKPFSNEDLVDVLARDVSIDTSLVKFKMIVVSGNEKYLEYIDEKISDGEAYNIEPFDYFRFFVDSYNDGIAKAYPELFENKHQDIIGTGNDGDIFVHSFTFQTTERCSLNCTYCYQFNKSLMRMEFDTAKKFIDNLLDDKYGYINRYNSPAIIIEFIGGEPLLEISLTRKIYEYFLDKCYELNHPWFTMHRLSICSNGMQYFDDDVQDFFKDYASQISFNISIDGNKKLHDACRIQPNGEGSYDICMEALNHYNKHYTVERNSKMTIAPSNIEYLYESVVDFINHGMQIINLNCVFEEGWTEKTALIEYHQLKKLADYIIENNLEHLYISIFNENQEGPLPDSMDHNSCGGLGAMLALRPNGQFYPCIRYMPTSVGDNVDDLCIGDVETGLVGRDQNSEILKMMDGITRRSQTSDICYECPIASACMNCSALSHAVYGTPDKRCTFICVQTIAECLANVYFWNSLLLAHPTYKFKPRQIMVPKEWALRIIDKDEWALLTNIELLAMINYIE